MISKLVSKYQKSPETIKTTKTNSITNIKLLDRDYFLRLTLSQRKSQSLVSYYNSETSETNEIKEILSK